MDNNDLDRLIHDHRAARAARLQELDGAFSAISLKAWLKIAQAAGLPCIPAEEIAALRCDAWLDIENPTDPDIIHHIQDVAARIAAFRKEPDSRSKILRWDFCSALPMKAALADGLSKAGHPGDFGQDIDPMDDRAIGILLHDHIAEDVPILARPWFTAAVDQDYPVEFRVFVREDNVQGVSNYYPQRALPDSDFIRQAATHCTDLATNLVTSMRQRGVYPWMPSYDGHAQPGTITASMDFLIQPDGQAVFIEAGPGFGFGAHPCCFIDRPIQGLALALAPGVKLR